MCNPFEQYFEYFWLRFKYVVDQILLDNVMNTLVKAFVIVNISEIFSTYSLFKDIWLRFDIIKFSTYSKLTFIIVNFSKR